jgi:hypothetical protein
MPAQLQQLSAHRLTNYRTLALADVPKSRQVRLINGSTIRPGATVQNH